MNPMKLIKESVFVHLPAWKFNRSHTGALNMNICGLPPGTRTPLGQPCGQLSFFEGGIRAYQVPLLIHNGLASVCPPEES